LNKVKAMLQLMRPANIVTAISDILAGIAISGFFLLDMESGAYVQPVVLLCLSTIGLYGGGVVFNDVFDAALDKKERPERPIPRGAVTENEASLLGLFLLVTGIGTAFAWQVSSGIIATAIAVASLVYDKWGKHQPVLGPLNMGLCRGLNLLLGISIIPLAVQQWWLLSIIPIAYIAAITLISRGEVHGGNKNHLDFAIILYLFVIVAIFFFAWRNGGQISTSLVLLMFFAAMIFRPLLKARQEPVGKNIGKAVKAGVIGLILMNALWAGAFDQVYLALAIVLLLPVSIGLGKLFAVT
jgi:4-hydroxybenzoate polyprenyltransferase